MFVYKAWIYIYTEKCQTKGISDNDHWRLCCDKNCIRIILGPWWSTSVIFFAFENSSQVHPSETDCRNKLSWIAYSRWQTHFTLIIKILRAYLFFTVWWTSTNSKDIIPMTWVFILPKLRKAQTEHDWPASIPILSTLVF